MPSYMCLACGKLIETKKETNVCWDCGGNLIEVAERGIDRDDGTEI